MKSQYKAFLLLVFTVLALLPIQIFATENDSFVIWRYARNWREMAPTFSSQADFARATVPQCYENKLSACDTLEVKAGENIGFMISFAFVPGESGTITDLRLHENLNNKLEYIGNAKYAITDKDPAYQYDQITWTDIQGVLNNYVIPTQDFNQQKILWLVYAARVKNDANLGTLIQIENNTNLWFDCKVSGVSYTPAASLEVEGVQNYVAKLTVSGIALEGNKLPPPEQRYYSVTKQPNLPLRLVSAKQDNYICPAVTWQTKYADNPNWQDVTIEDNPVAGCNNTYCECKADLPIDISAVDSGLKTLNIKTVYSPTRESNLVSYIYTVDNEIPALLAEQDSALEELVAHPGSLTVPYTLAMGGNALVLEGTMQDANNKEASAELELCSGSAFTDCEDTMLDTYLSGGFSFDGGRLQSDRTYRWQLTLTDLAGNSATIPATGTYGYFTPQVTLDPYYLSTYNVTPWSPTTPPGADGKIIKFELEAAKGSATADVRGVDLYASQCQDNVCAELLSCLATTPQGDCDLTPLGSVVDMLFGARGTLNWTVTADACPEDGCDYRLFFDVRKIGGGHYMVYKDTEEQSYEYTFASNAGELASTVTISGTTPLIACSGSEPADCEDNQENKITLPGSNLIPIFGGQFEIDAEVYKDRKVELEIYSETTDVAGNRTHAKISGIPLSAVDVNGVALMEFKHRYFISGSSQPFEPEHVYYLRLRLADPLHQLTGDWSKWYAFSLSRGEISGNNLPVSQLETGSKIADGTDQYRVSLVLLDRYGNYVKNLKAELVQTPLLNTRKWIYFDSLTPSYDKEDSAITLGNTLLNLDGNIYGGGLLRSAAPTVFADKEYALDKDDLTKTVLNRARGLVLGRDLDLGVKLSDDTDKEIWPAQSVSGTYFKDSDGDGYSDGMELTYGTLIDDATNKPAYLEQNFTAELLGETCLQPSGAGTMIQEVNSLDELSGTTCPMARLSGEPDNLYYFPSLAGTGEYAPAVNFRPPLSVTLQKLYKTEAGSWVAEHPTAEEMPTEHWSNDSRLILPKFEMLAEEEGRLRLELSNIGSTPIDLAADKFILTNHFNFAGEQARFNDLTFIKAYIGDDRFNMNAVDDLPSEAVQITPTGELVLKGEFIANLELAPEDMLWLDFSVRPGVYGNLITSRAYYNCEMELPVDTSNTATFPCSPEIIDLYRAESYIGVTQTLEEADRALKLQKVKDEMIANIMSETRPLPTGGATGEICLDWKNNDHYELFDEGELKITDCDAHDVSLETNPGDNSGVQKYRNGTVYAFHGRNVRLGDGVSPVYLPTQPLTIVTVGSNLIIASDLIPEPDTTGGQALGLVSIWDTQKENGNPPSDPISESSWNEAYKGGNILINSKSVTDIFSHIFAEGAVFNIDFGDGATDAKHLSSLYDILGGKNNKSYHFETKRQNTEDQLYIHGLFFAGYNTFRGAAEDKPYTEQTLDYLKYNNRLDLSFMRVFRGEGDNPVGEPSDKLPTGDTRALVIEPATDYGLPSIFQTKEQILMGEGGLP